MATEIFTVVALPHSVAADADFHVSLFISPRLTPDARRRRAAAASRYFPHWAALLEDDTTVELFDQIGPIESSRSSTAVDPDLWDAVFPPTTPVERRASRLLRAALAHLPRRRRCTTAAKAVHLARCSTPTRPRRRRRPSIR